MLCLLLEVSAAADRAANRADRIFAVLLALACTAGTWRSAIASSVCLDSDKRRIRVRTLFRTYRYGADQVRFVDVIATSVGLLGWKRKALVMVTGDGTRRVFKDLNAAASSPNSWVDQARDTLNAWLRSGVTDGHDD